MIKCKKCGYSVPSNLKYAIMSNICPSCGDVLFGDLAMSSISAISNDISRQEFSQDMNKVLINDIALFIFNSYYDSGDTSDSSSGPEAAISDTDENLDTSDEIGLERIRDEVRREVSLQDDENLVDPQDEDEDRRVARLKRLAKEVSSSSSMRGVSVKRVN